MSQNGARGFVCISTFTSSVDADTDSDDDDVEFEGSTPEDIRRAAIDTLPPSPTATVTSSLTSVFRLG